MCKQIYKISRQRFNLQWRKTDELVSAFIDRYNQGKPLGSRLRESHWALAKELIRQYSKQLSYHQAYIGQLEPHVDQLPMLETNNTYLANQLKCSTRKVRYLRTRLTQAGFLKTYVYRGQNAQYYLEIEPKVLYLQEQGKAENIIDWFLPEFQELRRKAAAAAKGPEKEAPAPPAPSPPAANFATYSNQLQEANTLNYILSGAPFQQHPDFQRISEESAVSSSGNSVEKPVKAVEKPQLSAAHSRNRKHIAGNTPNQANSGRDQAASEDISPSTKQFVVPDTAPTSLEAAIAHLSETLKKKLRNQISILWLYAAEVLYNDTYLEPEEIEAGKACLAEYFCYSKPGGWAGGNKEIMRRMMLVKLWIERGEVIGKQRFVPIPGSYFDIRKPKGFSQTKSWYKDDRKAVAEFVERGLFTKACNEYLRSCQPGAKYSTADIYKKWKQRLGKRSPALLDKFHKYIINVDKTKGAAA